MEHRILVIVLLMAILQTSVALPAPQASNGKCFLLQNENVLWVIDITSGILSVTYGGQHDISLIYASVFDWVSYLNGVWLSLAITVHTPCVKKTMDVVFKRALSLDHTSKQTELTKDLNSTPMIKK